MKKSTFVLASLAALTLVGCGTPASSSKPATVTDLIGLVTDVGSINDHSFNQACWKGVLDFCADTGAKSEYKQPSGDSTTARVASIDALVKDGAKVVVMVCQSNSAILVTDGATTKVSNINPSAVLPTWGLEAIDPNFTIGFVIACILAIIVWLVLEKTNLGFEIKACGLNKDAAKYAGINEKKNIILAFTISGALAGIGGALYILMMPSESL